MIPRLLALIAALVVISSSTIRAELVRFEITHRKPFADGQSFGAVGPYEKITGRAYFALDPSLRQNQAVVDLSLAARNADGLVEFWADLFILTPQDSANGNGALLYDVNNRGNKLALRMFNDAPGGNDPATADDAGNAFLMRQGFTIVWSGWDGELLPGNNRLRLMAPPLNADHESITGMVRCEFVPKTSETTRMPINWANHGAYRPTARTLDDPGPVVQQWSARLTVRERPAAQRVPVPRDQWMLHIADVASDSPTQLPSLEIEMPGGMQAGHLYELIYEASDPLVMGVGFTSVRDLISAIKHGTGDENPLLQAGQPTMRRAHGFGVSQSGRFLREFLYWGFNEDEKGRQVFDGLIPHVAGGGLGSFNHRFAQPTRHASQHDHHDYPPDRFPFAYETQTDPLSGQTEGILQCALETGTAPLVMHTQSSAEYWTRSGSLPHTDPLGVHDAQPPDCVRFYTFGGTQHGPAGWPLSRGAGQNLPNPGDYRPFVRALLLALDRWAADGTVPPPSVYPNLADDTLVDWRHANSGFPVIPGVNYPLTIQQPSWLDFGPRWQTERIVDIQPPRIRGDYKALVPRCGTDGNELGCLLPPEVAVPVATYTGWNLRNAEAGAEGELVSLTGSYIPFSITKAERVQTGDPRLSIQERYESLEDYINQFAAACDALIDTEYLLAEDAERLIDLHRERVSSLLTAAGAE